MRVGLLARMTDRGLGQQTRAFADNVDCDVLIVSNPDDARLGMTEHPEWYPAGSPIVSFVNGELRPRETAEAFVRDHEVIFSAETFYDWNLVGKAREWGVATVVQVNVEFFKHREMPRLPHPTQWVLPTVWLGARIPDAVVLPVPCPEFIDRRNPDRVGPLRVLHVVGHQAAGDRNGTNILADALADIRYPVELTVTCQDQHRPLIRDTGLVKVRHVAAVEDSADLYAGQDMIVIPRRYGGLCLSAQEAMASGLALAMTDTSPQWKTWPIIPVGCDVFEIGHRAPGGMVPLANAHPASIADVINKCAADRGYLAGRQAEARSWARANTWDRWRPEYLRVMADACDMAKSGVR